MQTLKKWVEIYQDKYLKLFSIFLEYEEKTEFQNLAKISDERKRLLCDKYYEMFMISCELLKSYLLYCGICQPTEILVLRQAFYSEIVSDGQKWINLLFLFQKYNKEKSKKNIKDVLKHMNKMYFKIFKQLNSYIQEEIKAGF